MRTPPALAMATLVALTACGGSSLEVAPSSAEPAAEMATCGGDGQAFPAHVATDPAPAEAVVFGDAPGGALHAFLGAGGDPGGGGFVWDGGEWLVLHRDDSLVQYAYRSERGYAYANADLTSSGWTVSNYGTCHPRLVGTFAWRVQGEVDRAASYVTISYEPLTSCGETVPTTADVDVTETKSEVGIVLRLTPAQTNPEPSDGQGCAAVGAAPVERRVSLDSPLGDRTLLDYGTVGHTPPAT